MDRNQQKRAFTLIEILVVIAIIALLAAILFPVFSRARENARSKNCMSNERQIAMSLVQYKQDNDRRFPPLNDAGVDGWAANIKLNSNQVFQCPSEGSDDTAGFTDYWLNADLLGMHDVRMRYPSNTILIGDGDAGSPGNVLGADADATSTPPIQAWEASGDYATRHLGGANYAFADGHVKWLNPDSIDTENAASGENFAFLPR